VKLQEDSEKEFQALPTKIRVVQRREKTWVGTVISTQARYLKP